MLTPCRCSIMLTGPQCWSLEQRPEFLREINRLQRELKNIVLDTSVENKS